MALKQLSKEELGLDPKFYDQVNGWLRRGDGIAVYENQELGNQQFGHRQFASFGSAASMLPGSVTELPERLPDTSTKINWRYLLVGYYIGEELE